MQRLRQYAHLGLNLCNNINHQTEKKHHKRIPDTPNTTLEHKQLRLMAENGGCQVPGTTAAASPASQDSANRSRMTPHTPKTPHQPLPQREPPPTPHTPSSSWGRGGLSCPRASVASPERPAPSLKPRACTSQQRPHLGHQGFPKPMRSSPGAWVHRRRLGAGGAGGPSLLRTAASTLPLTVTLDPRVAEETSPMG